MLLTYDRLGWWKWVLLGTSVLVAIFLLLPIAFIAGLSFGSSQWMMFPPPGWTLKWYRDFFADPRWIDAIFESFRVACCVTVLSVAIGLLAAFGLTRGKFRWRNAARSIFMMPMILPVVVLGVAVYSFFLRIGLSGTFVGFVFAHLVIALPFAIACCNDALERFDRSIEDAAVICGASPLQAKIRITIPSIRGGLFAAAVFSFLTSWDDVVLAIFMATPRLQTLPVKIWTTLRQDLTPVVAAASTLLTLMTVVLMLIVAVARHGIKK